MGPPIPFPFAKFLSWRCCEIGLAQRPDPTLKTAFRCFDSVNAPYILAARSSLNASLQVAQTIGAIFEFEFPGKTIGPARPIFPTKEEIYQPSTGRQTKWVDL